MNRKFVFLVLSTFLYFPLAHGQGVNADMERAIKSMFDNSPDMVSDLQVQYVKPVSRKMMVSRVSDFKTIINMTSCREAISMVEAFNKSDSLDIKRYNQLYEDVFPVSDVDRSSEFKKAFGEESFFELAYCMYHIGKSYGSVSSLNDIFYKPVINLQTGTVEEELANKIAEEILKSNGL
ncbi:hypothetical protein [Marinobacter sp. S0848L]|uniref:hypothetical protein n=1 Tax=Marinobacter sp. S0848L TaxID=2926423 RepID=UPI001FF3338D|nr:hypothetical protein [Marinobacter sp. S0848L]MCK0106957.1 hypothetical protein [Marinobacter sp. S0848L]